MDWLNDGVKGFLAHTEDLEAQQIPELDGLQNLRIYTPSPEYLLAMKCIAARTDETSQDRGDVGFLMRKLSISTEEEVFNIVGQFYPLERMHVRSRYFVGEVVEELREQRESECRFGEGSNL